MSLAPGARLGAYEVVALIGAGGMGEVYRARDTRLNRDVALKVLPDLFAHDPDRLARFKREAQVLASLNHPNIAAIHGFEESGGVQALVLELVEGPTLAEHLQAVASDFSRTRSSPAEAGRHVRREPGLPVEEVLPIARQIADALEAAHDHGVVHRDLKPANIKVTHDGTVKVLDFGLAKALDPVAQGFSPAVATDSPTISQLATRAGVILGTAAYMSPEQARGKTVDKRTDTWAFGCVLYEMLTGRRAFEGREVSDVLARILEREPTWDALPPETPANIRRLLRRCLDKDPKRRLHHMADVRIEIEEAAAEAPQTIASADTLAPHHRSLRFVWVAALLIGVALGGGWWIGRQGSRSAVPVEPVVTRLEVVTPPTPDPMSFALSPDGRQLAFVATAEGEPRLWLRLLDQTAARPLAGTTGASFPFWAPDGRAIGFFADGKLKRTGLGGDAPQVLADASTARGGTWNRDGVIVFAPTATGGLMRVPATGGTPAAVTQIAAGQGSHRWPQFLPDGRRFLFNVGVGRPDTRGVFVGSLDGGATARVLADETAAAYAPPNWLLVVRQGALVALRFDPVRAVVSGDPVPVAQGVGSDIGLFRGAFSVSAGGVLAHRPSGTQSRQLTWMDRGGKALGTVGSPDESGLANPALASDGRRLAVNRVLQGNIDVWLMDVTRGVLSRFTFDDSIDNLPLWSPDGRRVVFRSTRKGPYDLFEKPASGVGEEQPLLVTAENKAPVDWSPDGRTLLYVTVNSKTGPDLWALPMEGQRPSTGSGRPEPAEGRKPFPVVRTNFEDADGQFSPDGKWVAYESNESGRFEIYVQPFLGPDGTSRAAAAPEAPAGKWQVSTAGGSQPRWRHDGGELFYAAPNGRIMAVLIAVKSAGQTLETGTPITLFAARLASGADVLAAGAQRPQYVVTPDGRFLMDLAVDAPASPITVVLNWQVGLSARETR